MNILPFSSNPKCIKCNSQDLTKIWFSQNEAMELDNAINVEHIELKCVCSYVWHMRCMDFTAEESNDFSPSDCPVTVQQWLELDGNTSIHSIQDLCVTELWNFIQKYAESWDYVRKTEIKTAINPHQLSQALLHYLSVYHDSSRIEVVKKHIQEEIDANCMECFESALAQIGIAVPSKYDNT